MTESIYEKLHPYERTIFQITGTDELMTQKDYYKLSFYDRKEYEIVKNKKFEKQIKKKIKDDLVWYMLRNNFSDKDISTNFNEKIPLLNDKEFGEMFINYANVFFYE